MNWFILLLVVVDFGVGVVVYLWVYICDNCLYCNLNVYMVFYWFFVYLLVINFCVLIWDCYIVIVYFFKYFFCMIVR